MTDEQRRYVGYGVYGVLGFITVVIWYDFVEDTIDLFGGRR